MGVNSTQSVLRTFRTFFKVSVPSVSNTLMKISKFTNFCMLQLKFYKILVLCPDYFHFVYVTIKGKTWRDPEGSRRLSLLEFLDNQHMKLVRMSALLTDRLPS